MKHPNFISHNQNCSYEVSIDEIEEKSQLDIPIKGSMPPFGERAFQNVTLPNTITSRSAYQIFKTGNKSYGFDGWSTEIIDVQEISQDYYGGNTYHTIQACVRVKLKNGIIHDGIATCTNPNIRTARLGAVTEAIKYALSQFSTAFGKLEDECFGDSTPIFSAKFFEDGSDVVKIKEVTIESKDTHTFDKSQNTKSVSTQPKQKYSEDEKRLLKYTNPSNDHKKPKQPSSTTVKPKSYAPVKKHSIEVKINDKVNKKYNEQIKKN